MLPEDKINHTKVHRKALVYRLVSGAGAGADDVIRYHPPNRATCVSRKR